ncbi:MAG TPA: EAL domain-containing protein [Azospira sp.]|nr:EAL domain-containing protein [Azospira sp.]
MNAPNAPQAASTTHAASPPACPQHAGAATPPPAASAHLTSHAPSLADLAASLGLGDADIARRLAFLDVGEDDTAHLAALHAGLGDARRGFGDAFYATLRKIPELAPLLPDDATVERLQAAHETYFAELTAGPHDAAYVARRLQVGLTHARIGLKPEWYAGAFRRYLSAMLRTIRDWAGDDEARFLATYDALLKVVFFDLCLTLDTYFDADKRTIALRERAIESSVNGIFIADAEQPGHPLTYVNPAFARMLGVEREAALGKACPCERQDCADGGGGNGGCAGPGVSALRQAIADGRQGYTVLTLPGDDATQGAPRHLELFLAPVRSHDGALTHFVGVLNDVTDRRAAEERLMYLATHDPLTGLPNRALLLDRVDRAIARGKRGAPGALVFVDLDRFKLINDSDGHAFGDRVLVEVAQRLRAAARDGDTVARLGGDEFVLLVENLPGDDAGVAAAVDIAARVLAALDLPMHAGEREAREVPLGASLGIALYPKDGDDAATLLRHADAALYRAKEGGRGGYRFFTAEMNDEARDRLRLQSELKRALDAGQIAVHYQPQVDLASGLVTGVEALARWFHPELGTIPPDRFIPVAEETGLILPLGEAVLRAACRQAAHWAAGGRPTPVAVNLSPRQLRLPRLPETIAAILAETGCQPAWIELEITESAAMADPAAAQAMLARLRGMGLSIAIDDFGTGHSSLARLTRLPVDKLKIDKSFIPAAPDAPQSREDAAVVVAIVALGRQLGLRVVAEGVETARQRDWLAAIGCHQGQGWLFGRPQPAPQTQGGARRAA